MLGILPAVGRADDPVPVTRHFAYIDYQYIFTLELTARNVPILNFMNFTEDRPTLSSDGVELRWGGQRYPVKFFAIETGNPEEPVLVPNLKLHPRTYFAVLLRGDFASLPGWEQVAVHLESEVFELQPLDPPAFDRLAQRIIRINVRSPDLRDDFRVLGIEHLGKRHREPRKRFRLKSALPPEGGPLRLNGPSSSVGLLA
ncbi:MAG: hypothetical protein HY652_14865 [Acidobacteria bacterium]|nr:hypothetical protein [Acidobacteriota bacterium]